MTKRTEAELLEQEKMDERIYSSTRSLFEEAMLLYREAVQEGRVERANELQGVLLDNYNHASEASQRLMGLLRRTKNSG